RQNPDLTDFRRRRSRQGTRCGRDRWRGRGRGDRGGGWRRVREDFDELSAEIVDMTELLIAKPPEKINVARRQTLHGETAGPDIGDGDGPAVRVLQTDECARPQHMDRKRGGDISVVQKNGLRESLKTGLDRN